MVTSKGTIQKYLDDYFVAITNVDHNLPPSIKFLFDFLAREAANNQVGFRSLCLYHKWIIISKETPTYYVRQNYYQRKSLTDNPYIQVADPSVLSSWRNNALPLRFWVNILKNPEFVFDIEKTSTVDSCLSVVASTLMDACSSSAPTLTQDSPSSKLLFAKDLTRYKGLMTQFYDQITTQPPVDTNDLVEHMQGLSKVSN